MWRILPSEFSPIDIETESSVFETRRGALFNLRRPFGEIGGKLSYRAKDNLYNFGARYLESATRGSSTISSLDAWLEHWGRTETGAAECEMDLIMRAAQLLRGQALSDAGMEASKRAAEEFPERGGDAKFGGVRRYDDFRESPDYADWVRRAQAIVGAGTP